MGFKAISDEDISNHLKVTQNVASNRNLRSNNKWILIDAYQQSKTFEKQTKDISKKPPAKIQSVETLSVFKIKVKNHVLDQALARNFED